MSTSGRADVVYGTRPSTEPGSGIGPASIMNSAYWPLQSYLELGALPSAVPSARLHARFVVAEWGLAAIADTVELIVSELVTNGVKASRKLDHLPPVWLGLSGNDHQVLVAVWDGNEEPIQVVADRDDEPPDLEAEGGRGLLLVDSLSADWGVHWPDNARGKVVWSVVTASTIGDSSLDTQHQVQAQLPQRVPSVIPIVGPVRAMNDLAVLEQVRAGLKELE